jgi:nucleotide-binding universal stress UspA family protein
MFDRILVPLDGSLTSEAILPYLRRYFADAELILLRSPEVPSAAMPPEPISIAGEVRTYLSLLQKRLRQEGFGARTLPADGRPVEAVLAAARAERPDLIAMTTHGKTGSRRLLMGSVAERVVRSSPVPVFVVRPSWLLEGMPASPQEPPAPRNILVPLDGTDASFGVLSHVLELSRTWRGRVVLLHVEEGRAGLPMDERLARVQEEFVDAGLQVDRLEVLGNPVAKILEVSRGHEIDLIAMASRAGPQASRFDDDSLTAKVLRNTTVPLFVVHAEAEPATSLAVGGRPAGVPMRVEKPRRARRAARSPRPAGRRRKVRKAARPRRPALKASSRARRRGRA